MGRATHQFSQTKTADIPRSSFDLSHGLKTTFNAGLLIPILSLEVLPGDTINLRASLFGRLATPIKPILDNLFLETFFFFTPYRQVWENWTKFCGEQETPGDSTDFVVPIHQSSSATLEGQMGDYLGVPLGTVPDFIDISALPTRCYTHIYNFWFRDENLVDPTLFNRGDGPDTGSNSLTLNSSPRRRRKRRDYLTSALPWPQKGDAVVIPIGTSAPIVGLGIETTPQAAIQLTARETGGITTTQEFRFSSTSEVLILEDPANIGFPNIFADLTAATTVTINDLRESFQIQKLLERDARGGTRYPEILRAHFQVSDPSLLVHQRPLYLGGGSTRINITPVAGTFPTATDVQISDTPQGNLAAYGTVSATGHGFTASFTEHGHIIGIVNVRADLTYQQGLERYWSRQTRFDFYWPALSHLGEQAIFNSEIFVSNDKNIDGATFGYIPRYDEYRFKQSQITATFRSSAAASLDVWHLAQDFATLPVLDKAFIEDNPPIDRVVAVPAEPDFLLDVWFKIRAARPLPLYATPGLIDHF